MSLSDNSEHFELSSSPKWEERFESPSTRNMGFHDEDEETGQENRHYPFDDPIFSSDFFADLRTEDSEQRMSALQSIIGKLKASASSKTPEGQKLAISQIDVVVRLSSDCPYADVREALIEFLHYFDETLPEVKHSHPSVVTSTFILAADIPGPTPHNEELRQMFTNIYLNTGRLTHFERVFAFHPIYLEKFENFQRLLLDGEGALPITWRYYISIMASSQHNCHYLVHLQEERFLFAGGDSTWLKGIDFAPKKLGGLIEINAILSHQPWLLTCDHIEGLVRGAETWSISELVHAILIMCTFHSLAGFIWGLGITPEADLEDISLRKVFVAEEKDMSAVIKNTDDLLAKLQSPQGDELDAEEEREKAFEIIENEGWVPETPPPEETAILRGDLTRYTKICPPTRYRDFDVHAKEYSIFRIIDYSWSEHGVALTQKFCSNIWEPLDDLFDYTYRMTSYTLGDNRGVDTQPVRRAIWYYSHRLFGLFHDDYNYREVNEFLNKSIKAYLKKVICFPEGVVIGDFLDFGYNFSASEKCHVNLLMMESRKQAELLYGLHRIMQYMQR
eukprot:TRINITY_DN1861_c0_g1_i2.p1 TRINITY_DN1861_c0_g1~~TRINITY_DN1861_c0_g1_i2.p1  ORF type:complete len:562 (-),score=129.20 TRINITY_DN1861_c0_g1_i2:380-2065(-)